MDAPTPFVRTRHLSIRCTTSEKKLLEKAAEANNMPVSQFVRELSLAACQKESLK